MPVGVEQWRVAVGAMAKASTLKPRSPIGPHWKKWLKASDPVAYKGCVVLLVSIAQLVCCDVKQAEEEREEMANKDSECGLQLVSRRKTKVGNGQDCSVLIPSLVHLLLLCGGIIWFDPAQVASVILLPSLSLKYREFIVYYSALFIFVTCCRYRRATFHSGKCGESCVSLCVLCCLVSGTVSVIVDEGSPLLGMAGVQEVQQGDSGRGCGLTNVSAVL